MNKQQPNHQQAQPNQQQLMSLLCLALYRMGGEIVLNLDDLKDAVLLPGVKGLDGNNVLLTVDKYVKEQKATDEPGTE